VKSKTVPAFHAAFARLTPRVQQQVRNAYRRFAEDPSHPSLKFKRVHPSMPLFSVRIGRGYRALGIRDAEKIVWYWVGSHAEYDREISKW
jgi:hypothetical protein